MQTILFCVYDSKSKTFGAPFSMLTLGQAIRSFEDAVQIEGSMMNKHPGDFMLYEIGSFDDNKAELIQRTPLNLVAQGSEFAKRPSETLLDEVTRKMHSNGSKSIDVAEVK